MFDCGAASATSAVPSPADRFTYPGQSAEAARYNERWEAWMKRIPRLPAGGDAEMNSLAWMIGVWTAQPRDFPSMMKDPVQAEKSPASPATISWTAGKRWLRISFVAQPWNAEWTYYLGHDRAGRKWVLDYLATPSLVLDQPAVSLGWKGGGLTFRPVVTHYNGLRSVVRYSLVRSGPDAFRIVTEVRMPSGRFVAMDDVLFSRAERR